jgi:hypothetical protein
MPQGTVKWFNNKRGWGFIVKIVYLVFKLHREHNASLLI